MSSAATAGPPHRNDPSNGPRLPSGSPPVNEGTNGVDHGVKTSSRVVPHIDDLVAVKPDINALAPIRKLLLQGELYTKQADSHLVFKRPEIALQEYIKASIIIVDIIPRHKDYPELKSDRGDLHRLYASLQKRIYQQHEKFEEIKERIKEDNAQSGVQPAVHSGPPTEFPAHQQENVISRTRPQSLQIQDVNQGALSSSNSSQNGGHLRPRSSANLPSPPSSPGRGPLARQRPPVQPKPESLHGRVITTNVAFNSNITKSQDDLDLAARFARLRGPESHSPIQDPRIRTHSIGMPDAGVLKSTQEHATTQSPGLDQGVKRLLDRPLGPRDMPKVQSGPPRPQKIPLDLEIPTLPKLPAAIYSPAWNSDNPASSDMLRSSSRNAYNTTGRTASVASSNSVSRTIVKTGQSDYFGQKGHTASGNTPSESSGPKIPDGTTVTAEELMGYLKRGSHDLYMLLVDIRNREDFDSGHIMSHSIICVEPIVLRKGLSAEELGQSLVLSPEPEQNLFDARDSFDLVIYYDQSSSSSKERSSSSAYGQGLAFEDFNKAVFDYGYEKQLKRRPRLLVGGLDAWVDLVGYGALETSATSSSISTRTVASTGQRGTTGPMSRTNRRPPPARRTIYESRPLSTEQEARWKEAIREEAAAQADLFYIRTTEDFVRRFPEPSPIQESMVSPSEISSTRTNGNTRVTRSTNRSNELGHIPQIPVRPAPALPRQSYSGISDRTKFATSIQSQAIPLEFRARNSISAGHPPFARTGLTNLGTECYMNAVLQALKGSGDFPYHFLNWKNRPVKVPRKKGENTDPPQLLAGQLYIAFNHLCKGNQNPYNPTKLKQYIRAVNTFFGRNTQQDSEEFLGFLLAMLEDELNPSRNRPPLMELTASQEDVRRQQPLIRSSWMEWQRYFHSNSSVITKDFRGQTVITQTCIHCQHFHRSWDTWLSLHLEIWDQSQLQAKNITSQTLESALRERFTVETRVDDYTCDRCKAKGSKRREQISRCPEILTIMLRRQRYDQAKGAAFKCSTVITYPKDSLDIDPYFISEEGPGPEKLDNTFSRPFRYDLQAVVTHVGTTIHSGHYWSYVRETEASGKDIWVKYNDTAVTTHTDMFDGKPNSGPYLLFYQRQPTVRT